MNIPQIQKRIQKIEEYKIQIQKAKEVIDEQLQSHPGYEQANKKSKEAQAEKKRIKEEVLSRPENDKLVWEIKENKEEIATLEQILSQELVEYYQKNKEDSIEDANGEKRKFRISVKIFPKK